MCEGHTNIERTSSFEEAVREHVRIAASAGRICDDVAALGEFWKTKNRS